MFWPNRNVRKSDTNFKCLFNGEKKKFEDYMIILFYKHQVKMLMKILKIHIIRYPEIFADYDLSLRIYKN